MLVRKDFQYCAVKFTEAWRGKDDDDQFAKYESYYQGDGTGNFLNKNVQLTKEQLARRRMIGISKLLSFPAGRQNQEVKCGPIRLLWSVGGSVYFYGLARKEEDYAAHDIELAPTKWTDISQVNVFDKRLKWYRYVGSRKEIYIPVEELWEDKEEEKR